MTEKFNQQKREYQEDLGRKSVDYMEEIRRNCYTTWHTSLETEMERRTTELEGDFYKQAQSYKDSISADLAKQKKPSTSERIITPRK